MKIFLPNFGRLFKNGSDASIKYLLETSHNSASIDNRKIIDEVSPYTMTGTARVNALVQAIRYVVRNKIPGDIVECGVWRGGSMLAVARTLELLRVSDRDLFLFDTFSGMTEPTDQDVDLSGNPAAELLAQSERSDESVIWCISGLDEVRRTMELSEYPRDRIHYVEGDVLETLPEKAPSQIALLRLDTDWYDSTRHEMETLFPRLSSGGVLIIDDYGHWQGAQAAVEKFLERHPGSIELHEIDYTGRIGIKR